MFIFNSSIGKKFIQAVSGAFLIIFLLLHATINFFSVIDSFTGKYGIALGDEALFSKGDGLFKLGCDFMSTPVISIMVPILALGFVVHIGYGVYLTIVNVKARGGIKRYEVASKAGADSWSAKNMVILGILTWPGLAHMIRGQVLVTRENEYVTAAKAMGVKERTIAFKHILPNVISIIIVNLTLDFAGCLLTESGLSYLGFGVQLPRPTWGNMLNKANNSTTIQNFWWEWLFPALFLATTTICINMIGDALRDVMDPKSNSEK